MVMIWFDLYFYKIIYLNHLYDTGICLQWMMFFACKLVFAHVILTSPMQVVSTLNILATTLRHLSTFRSD